MEAEAYAKNGRGGPARLAVVDDHALARAGLRDVLADEPTVEIVGEATDGQEALALCARLQPDLVLMDVRMPKMDGLEATRAIKRHHPRVVVLMLTMHENPDYLFEALKAGAAGYVLKDATEDEIVSAIRRALDGESPLDQDLAAGLLRRMIGEAGERKTPPPRGREERSAAWQPLEPLTSREIEVLKLVVTGKTNRQIAEDMVISANTVKTHVQHVIGKLGVSDRTQAATLAIEMGLLG